MARGGLSDRHDLGRSWPDAAAEARRLVSYFDRDAGLLDRAVFSSNEIYEEEQRRIFRRCWLFVGPENWVSAPGDYLVSSMGETPVLAWHTPAGQLRLFVNRCPMGDGVLAEKERGSADVLQCSCHRVPYGPDGVAGHSHLKPTEVAQIARYRGLVFGTFDPEAVPLVASFGDFAWYLDMFLDRRARPVEAVGGAAFRWEVEANWKVAAEAFAGDVYSDLTLHAATNTATDRQSPSARGQGLQVTAGGGAIALLTKTSLYAPSRVVADYEASIAGEVEARLGQERGSDMIPLVGTLFPNLSFDWRSRSLHVWQPRGPMRTEINTYCLVDEEAPQAVKDAMRRTCQLHFGPAGLRAEDQAGPWKSLTERSSHSMAGAYPLNLQMGLNRDLKRNLPGRVSDLFSEMNQRSFFAWWEDRLNDAVEAKPVGNMMRIGPSRPAPKHKSEPT